LCVCVCFFFFWGGGGAGGGGGAWGGGGSVGGRCWWVGWHAAECGVPCDTVRGCCTCAALGVRYEGDLAMQAGVSYTFGRESNETYGEPLAGVQPVTGYENFNPVRLPCAPRPIILPWWMGKEGGCVCMWVGVG
jgi:hypothetical protein